MSRALLLVLLVFVGCTETEVRHGETRIPGVTGEGVERTPRETHLLERVEKDPKDAQGWFELGSFYESSNELARALDAYQHGNALVDPTRYTGGNYLIARVYLRLEQYDRSLAYLEAIGKLEPKDAKQAARNPHFAEAHYLRGAIYYVNKQWKPARDEFLRFIERGGDPERVEVWLQRIRDESD